MQYGSTANTCTLHSRYRAVYMSVVVASGCFRLIKYLETRLSGGG